MAQGPSHVYTPPSGVPPLEGVPPLGVPQPGQVLNSNTMKHGGRRMNLPSEPAQNQDPQIGGYPQKGGPKMGPKSRSNIGGSDGRQCDLAHINCPRDPSKWGPQTPDWGLYLGPHSGGFPGV